MNKHKISLGCISILRKMFNNTMIGGKHIPEVLCIRWIRNLPRKEHRKALKDLEICIKEGLILVKPEPSSRHLSLNPRRLDEIKNIIK